MIDLYIGVPAMVNASGIKEIIQLHLNEVDQAKFDQSCETLMQVNQQSMEGIL